MRRYGPTALLLLVGAAVLRISLFSALYLRYVQSGLRPYLVVSGTLLVLLGVTTAVRAARAVPEKAEGPHDHGHDHTHTTGPRFAWLLTLPATALLLFPPPTLGSYSAAREDEQRAAQGVGTFPALPVRDPVECGDGGAWYVTRLLVSCCAADAITSKVQIRGADAPVTDNWVTVTGWHPKGKLGSTAAWPLLDAKTIVRVAEPSDPYEKR
ncbi:DUF1980 domain-containing protein [Streptomyces canus]|uniref:TIGR03943 family putative permease subunit n=1 Tax=Streptomyces canus TaxID=58343 RepID=UPI00039AC5F8|nr:DUF1980 domain-containing protein [Streptomyces canus]